ncbi:hypothetical protein OPT61_g5060 [Boeremia exigua]|uniref:Uncharacterized protein n=1 Tax=Boeremia exigua TaxID=749465 RepID=A0ACC2IBQ3_9PLEO|nr:hypothetical protein OPT61_g5060 [Boeremia exigua]
MQANTSDDDEVLGSPIPTAANSDAHVASIRACENCRTRKRYSERKIDLIEDRLGTITKLLKELLKTNGTVARTCQEPASDTHNVVRTTSAASSPNLSKSVVGPGVEGESSLSAHSIFVNEFLRDFVQPDPEIRRTLEDLSNIVSDSRQQGLSGESPQTNVVLRSRVQQKRTDLPPFPKVAALIRLAKAQRLAGSGWVYEYITMKSFGDLCLEVYYSDEPSLFDCVSVYAGLFSLFWDYACMDELPDIEKEQSMEYCRRCQDSLEIGLAGLPLQLPTSSNVVASLLFACFYAIGCSKPLLCWSLASKASEICQTLGYHRKTVARIANPESSSYTQFLFWTTYSVDKTLSLRLGRASTIPNWEISIGPPDLSNADQDPVLAYFVLWIKLARIQGNIYEMLYSPESMLLSVSDRQSRVDLLRKDLDGLDKETQDTMKDWYKISKMNSGENLMEFYATSDAVLRLSLLTHVCRAAPRADDSPTTFDPYCVEVARATMEKHHDCMAIIRKRNNVYFSTYVHWTLLFAPFVPFIVIFCNVMETQDQMDLARLDAFVQSIQPASTVSAPAARMHRLFQVLQKIATRYITLALEADAEEARFPETNAQLAAIGLPHARAYSTSRQHEQSSNYCDEMDTQLLYEPNNPEIANNEPHFRRSSVNSLFWMGNGAQLENWFYDNQMSMDSLQL